MSDEALDLERGKRLLEEHQSDFCDHEPPGMCPGGCVRAFCISDRHKGDVSPEWPCNVARRVLGVKSVEAYWEAEDAAWMVWHQEHYPEMYA